jgi:hypothetical protein
VAAGRRRFPGGAAQRHLADRFLAALATGDLAVLSELLVADAAAVTDHGGKARANRRTVAGAGRVARLLAGLVRKGRRLGITAMPTWINGSPGLVAIDNGRIDTVLILQTPWWPTDHGWWRCTSSATPTSSGRRCAASPADPVRAAAAATTAPASGVVPRHTACLARGCTAAASGSPGNSAGGPRSCFLPRQQNSWVIGGSGRPPRL